jgi:hypothetical protein
MLKKLLYLYNDGHNPFPVKGKGGLGYHLPGYRKRIHGEGLHEVTNEDGETEYIDDTNTNDTNLYSKEGFVDDSNVYNHITPSKGSYLPMNQGGTYIPSDTGYYKPPDSSHKFYVTKDPKFKKDYHGNQKLNPNDIASDPAVEDEEDFNAQENYARELLMEKEYMDSINTMSYQEQQEIISEDYNNIVKYYKKMNPTPGKGYEDFLCGPGSTVYKTFNDDESIKVFNMDQNSLIDSKEAKDHCPIDFVFTGTKLNEDGLPIGGIGEAKDRPEEIMRGDKKKDFIAIQITKLVGHGNYEIIYDKDNDTGKYYLRLIAYNKKQITPDISLDNFNITVNAGKTSWICNLFKNKYFIETYLNDDMMYKREKGDGYIINKHIMKRKKLISMEYVSSNKEPVEAFKIPKLEFKKWNKKLVKK